MSKVFGASKPSPVFGPKGAGNNGNSDGPRVIQAYFPGGRLSETLRSWQARVGQRSVVQARRTDKGHAFPTPPGFLKNRAPGSGQPLQAMVKSQMESFFQTDFSNVRVHVGPEAPSIGALAFTVGTNLYFAPGQYQPNTPGGRQLIGHELTHVVQQAQGRVSNPYGSGLAVVHDPGLEEEAERKGEQASRRALIIPYQPRTNKNETFARRIKDTSTQPSSAAQLKRSPKKQPPKEQDVNPNYPWKIHMLEPYNSAADIDNDEIDINELPQVGARVILGYYTDNSNIRLIQFLNVHHFHHLEDVERTTNWGIDNEFGSRFYGHKANGIAKQIPEVISKYKIANNLRLTKQSQVIEVVKKQQYEVILTDRPEQRLQPGERERFFVVAYDSQDVNGPWQLNSGLEWGYEFVDGKVSTYHNVLFGEAFIRFFKRNLTLTIHLWNAIEANRAAQFKIDQKAIENNQRPVGKQ